MLMKKGNFQFLKKGGFIMLIPKPDSNLLELQNWRPITLLNTDYKIAVKTKAVARRIEQIIPKLTNSDQTGFVKVAVLVRT